MDPLYRILRELELEYGEDAALEYIRAIAFVPSEAANILRRAWAEIAY